jgi:hypothetical protein
LDILELIWIFSIKAYSWFGYFRVAIKCKIVLLIIPLDNNNVNNDKKLGLYDKNLTITIIEYSPPNSPKMKIQTNNSK